MMKDARNAVRLLALTMLWGIALSAQGHGAHSKPYGGEVRAYQFEYALGEPLRRAEVSVYPPDSEQRYLQGWTDQQGVFAFAPARPGAWRLEIRDGKGHAIQRYVRVGPTTATSAAPNHDPAPALARHGMVLLLALSLLLNAWLSLMLLQQRQINQRQTTDSPEDA